MIKEHPNIFNIPIIAVEHLSNDKCFIITKAQLEECYSKVFGDTNVEVIVDEDDPSIWHISWTTKTKI